MPLLWLPREKAGAAEVMPLLCSRLPTTHPVTSSCLVSGWECLWPRRYVGLPVFIATLQKINITIENWQFLADLPMKIVILYTGAAISYVLKQNQSQCFDVFCINKSLNHIFFTTCTLSKIQVWNSKK